MIHLMFIEFLSELNAVVDHLLTRNATHKFLLGSSIKKKFQFVSAAGECEITDKLLFEILQLLSWKALKIRHLK